jgi:hypothetical protein
MTKEVQDRQWRRKRLWVVLAALGALLAVFLVPPLVSLNHYQKRVSELLTASLGRPVRISGVRARLLPSPAFVVSDLTVEEDPAYGAEPVLHATTVKAPISLLALWRGRLAISRISVDEASLNLVRTPEGRWNLESLFGQAHGMQVAAARPGRKLPFLKATNSRLNFKNGAEKMPFSLVDTDLELWQDRAGEWRLELKGQPARTDLSVNQGDTGTVQLRANLRGAAQMRQMPVQLDLAWKNAQLGQLTRLALGRDPGWRGDLKGNLHAEGTAESATVQVQLKAVGVHREEFAPAAMLDFDANCGLVYHYSLHTAEKIECNSPLGAGRARLTGSLPGAGQTQLTLALDRIPVAAGLDALRTVRSGVSPNLVAAGTISGSLVYDARQVVTPQPEPVATKGKDKGKDKKKNTPQGPLSGSLAVDGFQLSGGGLSQPLAAEKIVLEADPAALLATISGTASFAAGGATPLTVNLRLGHWGYSIAAKGPLALARGRELAHAAGWDGAAQLDALAGEAANLDVTATGPWMPPAEETQPTPTLPGEDAAPVKDTVTGTVALANANWKAGYMVNAVQIAQATLHLDSDGLRWDPVAFSYGPVKGTATLWLPAGAAKPQFTAQFAALDAKTLQAALLGAQTKETLLAELLNKLHPAQATPWPTAEGTVKVDTLTVGPAALKKATVALSVNAAGVEVRALDADLEGGKLHLNGSMSAGSATAKPAYTLTGSVENATPAAVGQLLGQHWSGGAVTVRGHLELAGYSADDLANSAKGTLAFDWQHGAVAGTPTLSRFDRWKAEAVLGEGKITLGKSEAVQGARKSAVGGSIPLSLPAKLNFAAATDGGARH